MNYYLKNSDHLMHYGVKGMKWGVRKYTTSDGQLTPEGIRHYQADRQALLNDRNEALKERQSKLRKWEHIRDARNMSKTDIRLKNSLYIARKGSKYSYISKDMFDKKSGGYDEFIDPYQSNSLSNAKKELEYIERAEFDLRKIQSQRSIAHSDELYHYGVKGMKWGIRHDPERSGGRQTRKGMSTAKKVAIGVGIAATVAGVSYVAVTKHNNKVARAAVKRVLAHRGGRPINVSRGPTHTTFSPAENGLVNVHRNTPRKLTGHSGLVTRAGAARHRYQFYSRKAQSAPITWDYMKNRGASRRVFEEKANSAGEELLKAHKNGGYVSLNRRSSIPRLRRTKRVLGK